MPSSPALLRPGTMFWTSARRTDAQCQAATAQTSMMTCAACITRTQMQYWSAFHSPSSLFFILALENGLIQIGRFSGLASIVICNACSCFTKALSAAPLIQNDLCACRCLPCAVALNTSKGPTPSSTTPPTGLPQPPRSWWITSTTRTSPSSTPTLSRLCSR